MRCILFSEHGEKYALPHFADVRLAQLNQSRRWSTLRKPPVTANPDHGQVVSLAPGQTDYRILVVEHRKENWLLLQRPGGK